MGACPGRLSWVIHNRSYVNFVPPRAPLSRGGRSESSGKTCKSYRRSGLRDASRNRYVRRIAPFPKPSALLRRSDLSSARVPFGRSPPHELIKKRRTTPPSHYLP